MFWIAYFGIASVVPAGIIWQIATGKLLSRNCCMDHENGTAAIVLDRHFLSDNDGATVLVVVHLTDRHGQIMFRNCAARPDQFDLPRRFLLL